MTSKRCKCGVTDPAQFNKCLGNTDGLQTLCRACQLQKQKERRARNKAKNAAGPFATVAARLALAQDLVDAGMVHDFDIDVEEPDEVLPDILIRAEQDVADSWWARQAPLREKLASQGATSSTVPPLPGVTDATKSPIEVAYEMRDAARTKRDLKREHSALLDENERLRTTIREMVPLTKPPDVLVYRQPSWVRSDAVACAAASDWHVEEPVDLGAVHGLNEYSLDIAQVRSEHFFKNFLRLADIMARETKVTTLHISFLGDFFSGWIHEELLANTLLAPGAAAKFVLGLFVSGIDYILRESSFVLTADLLPGNHGRMTEKMHLGDPTGTSLETFMYHALAGRYAGNPRVDLRVSDHAMVYRRFFEKFTMRLIHGYEVKYGGGVGGITIPIRKALAQWDKPVRADLTVMGHFHQLFDGGDFLVNGSLIGYNEFAQAIKASYEEARQAFFMIHARNGGQKGITAPIWLDDAHHRAPTSKTTSSAPTGTGTERSSSHTGTAFSPSDP